MTVAGGNAGDPRREVAARGETIAARWLDARGYRILERNRRIGRDEADLIALDPDSGTIVIVEVKTRTGPDRTPEARVDARKRYRLARLAARLQATPRYADRPMRFDVVAVVLPRRGAPIVRHSEAAFDSPF
jgi:putative endonuclease